jgi:hypothetical protein
MAPPWPSWSAPKELSCGRPCSERGGSCPCPRRFIWGWGSKGGLPDAPSAGGAGPHFRESSPSRRGRPFLGPERGPACMELRRIPGDHRINPARGGGGRGASWGWKGMRPGGPQAGAGPRGSDPPPEDPLRPPLRGLEGPGRGGVVEKTAPPYPPPSRASQGGSLGRRVGDFAVLEGENGRFARPRAWAPPPTIPSRTRVVQEDTGLISANHQAKKRPRGCTPTPA